MPSTCETSVHAAGTERGTATIGVRGEIDGSARDVLPAAYAAAVAAGDPATVLLDLAGVDYINSTGIAVIVGVLALARADHRTVAVAGLTEHYRHIFTITRLVDFIQIVEPADGSDTRATV